MNEHLYIICHLGNKMIAILGEQIVEVIPACEIVPLPIHVPHVKGLLIRDEKAIVVLDETLPFFEHTEEEIKYFIILSLNKDEIAIAANRIETEIAIADHVWQHCNEDVFTYSCLYDGKKIYRLELKAWGGDDLD